MLTQKPLGQIAAFSRGTTSLYTAQDGTLKGVALSITPNTIGSGTKTFTLQGGNLQDLGFVAGQSIRIVESVSGTSELQGTCVSYSIPTQTIVVSVTVVIGSGTFSNWRVGVLDPAYDYDPITKVIRGIRISPVVQNLLTYSEDFRNGWTVSAALVFPTASVLSPDGRSATWKFVGTTANAIHVISQSITPQAGQRYVFSVYAKAAELSRFALLVGGAGAAAGVNNTASATFELSTGTAVSNQADQSEALIEAAGNGWYRCSLICPFTTTSVSTSFSLRLTQPGGAATTFASDNFSGIYIYGAQVIQAAGPVPYVPSAVAFTSRASGAVRVSKGGLLVGFDSSTSNNTVGTGSKTFTLMATAGVDRGWIVGESVARFEQTGTPANFVQGTVTAYNPTTQVLTINADTTGGTGTISAWNVRDYGARFSFDPSDLTKGPSLVLEGARTNILLQSENLENASWSKVEATAAADVTVAPTGIIQGDKLVESVNNALHYTSQSVSVASGNTYCMSVYAKAAERSRIQLSLGAAGFGSEVVAAFDLSSGTATQPTVGTGSAAFLYPAGNGWYRCVLRATATATASTAFRAYLAGAFSSTLVTYTGDGSSGLYLWGFQLESLNVVAPESTYIPTTTASVARAADVSTSLATTRGGDNLQVTGSAFSQFFTAPQGTLIVKGKADFPVSGVLASFNDGTANNSIRIINRTYPTSVTGTTQYRWTGIGTGTLAEVTVGDNLLRHDGTIFTPASSNAPGVTTQLFRDCATSDTGIVLAVGGQEILATTSDGLTWSGKTVGGVSNHLVYGGPANLWLSAGTNGSIRVSTDGLAWQRVQVGPDNIDFAGIAANASTYVAVGPSGTIYTSTDGFSWTARTSGTTLDFRAISNNTTRFVAVGPIGNFRYSDDNGVTWTAATGQGSANGNDVHFANSLFVTVSSAGIIQTSANGATWTSATSNTTQNLSGVTYDSTSALWVACGAAGTVVYTTTPTTTWTDGTARTGTTQGLQEIDFANGLFVAVGGAGTIVTNSATNITGASVSWTTRTSNVTASLNGIATLTGTMIVTGAGGVILGSTDSVTYIPRSLAGATLSACTFGAGTFVVGGQTSAGALGVATVSSTGVYQRRSTGLSSGTINGGCFKRSAFYLAVTASRILRSTDGISWSTITLTGTATDLFQIADSGSLFVAVGATGRYATSSDGLTWNTLTASGATTQQLNDITFANGLFVAVGNNGAIITSANGTTWTSRATGTANLFGAYYSTRDSLWYASGTNTILKSSDAITWTDMQGDVVVAVFQAGILRGTAVSGKFTGTTFSNVAMTYDGSSVTVSANGSSPVQANISNFPTVDRLSIGMSGLVTQYLNGNIASLAYSPTKYTNVQLQAASA